MANIRILDDAKKPTIDFIAGRPLVRVSAWLNGRPVIRDGHGLVDTGSTHSFISEAKIGDLVADRQLQDPYNDSKMVR